MRSSDKTVPSSDVNQQRQIPRKGSFEIFEAFSQSLHGGTKQILFIFSKEQVFANYFDPLFGYIGEKKNTSI